MLESDHNDEKIADESGNHPISPTSEMSAATDALENAERGDVEPQEGDGDNLSIAIVESESNSSVPEIEIVASDVSSPKGLPSSGSALDEDHMEDSPAVADDDDLEIEATKANQGAIETVADTIEKGNSTPQAAESSKDVENTGEEFCPDANVQEESKKPNTEDIDDGSIVEEAEEGEICGMPKRKCFAAAVVVLVILAIALGIGVGVTGKESSTGRAPAATPVLPEPTAAVTSKPTSGPFTLDLASIVLPPGKELTSLGATDPEFLALEWMAESDVRGVPLEANSVELLERFALATLYFATGGDNLWTDNFLWLSGGSHCGWSMIECSGDSVRGIYMGFNNLSGTLPVEIFWNLKNVVDVNLGSNSLSGTLPTEIGLWTEASFVNVEANAFNDRIPTTIGKMTSLTNFGAALNQLSGSLPSEIGMLSKLTSLQLW